MSEVETRRTVPISKIVLICIILLGLFQLIMLTGAYEVESSTVKKVAPWFYETFRKVVGEHPSTNPLLKHQAELAKEKGTESSSIATVAGFNPAELSVTIDAVETPVLEPTKPVEEPTVIIPVSQPEKPDEPVDEDIPVG